MPRKIWLVMTPGVAAGPHQRPEADRRRDPIGGLAGGASASSRAALTVAYMFEPVSPSGTG